MKEVTLQDPRRHFPFAVKKEYLISNLLCGEEVELAALFPALPLPDLRRICGGF
jgi:hypothetical protein